MAEPETANEPIAENGRMTPLGERTFLGSRRVATRVRLFIMMALITIAATGGLYYFADTLQRTADRQIADAASISETAAKIDKLIWQLKSVESDYAQNRDAKHIGVYQSIVKSLNTHLTALESIQATKTIKEHIATVHDGIAQHTKAFERLTKNDDEKLNAEVRKFTSRLNTSAKAIEIQLTKANVASLNDSFAHARQSEARFKASGATAELQAHAKQLDEFKRLLATAPISQDERGVFERLMQAYQNDITALAKVRLSAQSPAVRLDEISAYLLPSLNGITEFAARHAAVVQDETIKLKQKAQMTMIGGTASILIWLTVFGVILMQSLTAPVRNMARAAETLVKGDPSARLPALGNHDEIGEVARALNILKETIAEAAHLQRQLTTTRTSLNQTEKNLADAQSKHKADQESAAAVLRQVRAEAEQTQQALEKELASVKEKAKQEAAKRVAPPPPPSSPQPPAEPKPAAPASVPAVREEPIETIAALSDRLAQSSQTASAAAFEAERTSALIRGLNEAETQLEKIEPLIRLIGKETNLPAANAANTGKDTHSNLVALTSEANGEEQPDHRKRLETIRKAAIQVLQVVRTINRTMADAKGAALEIAAASSAGALEITSDLLEQSENLRGMLNNLIGKLHSTTPPEQITPPKPTPAPTPAAKPMPKQTSNPTPAPKPKPKPTVTAQPQPVSKPTANKPPRARPVVRRQVVRPKPKS